ncbi:probable proteasome inhibitor [Papaver somniferum]|uniref:probable proteasome inhibitor n=1 Tax=Papaver somniferum TaxID=3469 RepID=UPI000E704A4F|nr:probable proteasome inhibitor [Papaver somniferum]
MANEESVMAVIRATRPNFRNGHDKVGFAVHAMFLNSGYFLTATGSAAYSDTILTCPPSDEVGIDGWNQSECSYGFVYSKIDKAGAKYTVLLKCLVMGDFLVIDFISSKYPDKEPLGLRINVNDCNGGGDERPTNFANQFRNFDELVKKLNVEIFCKLNVEILINPGLQTLLMITRCSNHESFRF